MSSRPRDEAAEIAILRRCDAGAGRSIDPSEAAPLLDAAIDKEPKRRLHEMPRIRQAAVMLAKGGVIDISRKGKPISPEAMRGAIHGRLCG